MIMKSSLMVLMLSIIASLATIDKTSHTSSVVFEKQGTILQNRGVVAMNVNDLLISVFVKADLPKPPKPHLQA